VVLPVTPGLAVAACLPLRHCGSGRASDQHHSGVAAPAARLRRTAPHLPAGRRTAIASTA
jgi:hypothetical protein